MKKLLILGIILLLATPCFGAVTEMGWTSDIDNIWSGLKATNNSVYTNYKSQAENLSCTNDNYGLNYAIMYKVEGDSAFCDKAFNSNGQCYEAATYFNRNKSRDCFVERALSYSICGDVVSAGNKTTWESQLDSVVSEVSNSSHGTRPWDTDELMGHYFGCMIYDLAKDGTIDQCTTNAISGNTFGGVDATSTGCYGSTGTLRNCVESYFERFGDGDFIEGTEYNKNTLLYALMGVHSLNDYYGVDKFPEITGLYDDIADSYYQRTTPDYSQHFQWGDIQSGFQRTHNRYRAQALYAAIAHLDSNDVRMWDLYDGIDTTSCVRMSYGLFVNPTTTRTGASGVTYDNAAGTGLAFWHSGWGVNDSFFASQNRQEFSADHSWNVLENFELWRNDAWVTTARKHYYSGEYDEHPYSSNLLILGGFGGMREAKGQVNFEGGTDYMYHSGVTSGSYVNNNKTYGFPVFVRESSNQKLFRHNPDGTDTVFLFHRIDACRPDSTDCMSASQLASLDARARNNFNRVDAEGYKHIYVLNLDVEPSKSSDKFSWTASNGDAMEFQTYMDSYTNEEVNMATVSYGSSPYYFGGYLIPSEKSKWQLRLKIATAADALYSFVNVLNAGGSATYTEVTETTGEDVKGAMVENATDRVVALFCSEDDTTTTFTSYLDGVTTKYDYNRFTKAAEMHKFQSGSSVQFTTDDTKDIDVFILGIDGDYSWTVIANGAVVNAGTPTNGVLTFTISGVARTHTVTWSAAGGVTCNDECAVCSDQTLCEASTETCYWHDNNGETSNGCFNFTEPTPSGCDVSCYECSDSDGGTECAGSALTCYFHDNNGDTADRCQDYPEPTLTTCDDECSICTDQTTCEASTQTCYWHDNDGATALQCNSTEAPSDACVTDFTECFNQDDCETNGYCWLVDTCLSECPVEPPGDNITITPTEDTYLSEAAVTTNYNEGGLKIESTTGAAGGGNVVVIPTEFTLGGADSGDLSATSTRLTHASLSDNDVAYAYKDFGASYFGDFDIDFTVRSNRQNSASKVGYFCLSDTIGDMSDMNAANDGICVGFQRQGTDGWFVKAYKDGTDLSGIVAGVAYETRYINISRTDATCTVGIYTDSDRTTHATGSPVSGDCTSNSKRYLYLAASNGSDSAYYSTGDGYSQNMTIIQADTAEGGSSGTDFVSMAEFDLSAITTAESIIQAKLKMTWSVNADGNTGRIYVYTGQRDFVEAQATWTVYSTGNSWTELGAKGSGDVLGSWSSGEQAIAYYDIGGAESIGDEVEFTNLGGLTTLISSNLAGSIYLYFYEVPSETGSLATFYDSENGDSDLLPKLEITYDSYDPIVSPLPSPFHTIGGGKIEGRWSG